MSQDEILKAVRRLLRQCKPRHWDDAVGTTSEARELIRISAGISNDFYLNLMALDPLSADTEESKAILENVSSLLRGFLRYVKNGMIGKVPLERDAEALSSLMSSAQRMLAKSAHPTAPAVLIGATFEEFLRRWVDEIAEIKSDEHRNILGYANLLQSEKCISGDDVKDIESWNEHYTDAIKGSWNSISNDEQLGIVRDRVNFVLMGVNLFIRKYS